MSKTVEIILKEPYRTNAARKINRGKEYAGPTFTDCKVKYGNGVVQVGCKDLETGEAVVYSYPYDTVARIKEYAAAEEVQE